MRLYSTIALAALATAIAVPGAAEAKVHHRAAHASAEPVEGALTTAEQLQMAQQQLAMNQKLTDSLTNFQKRFNKTYKFDYIMGFKNDGEILIANDTLDITRTILDAINKEYQERKK